MGRRTNYKKGPARGTVRTFDRRGPGIARRRRFMIEDSALRLKRLSDIAEVNP